jgi:glycosyltransferase involved in cell wall biosynthesis
MRTAFINGALDLGGANSFLLNLGQELIFRGHEVRIFCLEENASIPSAFDQAEIHIETCAKGITEDRVQAVLNHLKSYQPRVVVSNLGPLSFEILRYVPKEVRKVGMAHSDDPPVYRLFAQYAPYIDEAVAVSEKIASQLASLNLPKSLKIQHLSCGVPMPAEYKPSLPRSGPLQLLYLGRVIKEQKRIQFLPLITDELYTAGIPFHLTVVGDGPELPWLQEQFNLKNYASQVQFTGALSYGTYDHILYNSDIFILPSEYEGLPLSLLETMGHGVVPVVSDLPSGMREVVNSENGFLIPPDSPQLYAEAIIKLERDRKKLLAMSRKAYEKVKDFYSTSAMAERWLKGPGREIEAIPNWNHIQQSILPLLGFENKILYTPTLRPLRRLLKKMLS